MARSTAPLALLLLVGSGCGHATWKSDTASRSAAYPTTGATVATTVEGLPECEGIPYDEINQSVLGQATATRNLSRHSSDRQRTVIPTGIAVTVPAERGHNAAYVQRVLGCQAAQARQTNSSGPLSVAGTRTRVVQKGSQNEIRLENDDPALAREVQLRMVDGSR